MPSRGGEFVRHELVRGLPPSCASYLARSLWVVDNLHSRPGWMLTRVVLNWLGSFEEVVVIVTEEPPY